MRGLADTDREAEILTESKGWSGGLASAPTGLRAFEASKLAFANRARDLHVYGDKLANEAFVRARATGSRFNESEWGAWYCGFGSLTSMAEVGFHRTMELSKIGVFRDETRYVELLADFEGEFQILTVSGAIPR